MADKDPLSFPLRLRNERDQGETEQTPDKVQRDVTTIDLFFDSLAKTSEIREALDTTIVRQGVLAALQGQHGKLLKSLMKDLCLLNTTDTADIEEVTTALCNYRRCRHILIDDETIKLMRDAEERFKGSEPQKDDHIHDSPTRARSLGIPDSDETLEEFFQRHDKYCRLTEDVSIYDGEQVQLSQNRPDSRISVQSIDNILGIAGFRPEKSLCLLPEKSTGEGQDHRKEVSRNEVLDEIWDHVKVERTGSEFCAEISLKPFSSFGAQGSDIDDIYQQLVNIISIYSRVAKVKEKLQSIGVLGTEIVYLKRRGTATSRRLGLVDTGEADFDLADGYIIETVSLNMETLNELLTTVYKFYDKFQKFGTAGNKRGWFSWAVLAVVEVARYIGRFLGFPEFITLGLVTLVSSFTNAWGSATDEEIMTAVSDFGGHARPILEQLRLPTIQISPLSAKMLPQDTLTLHKIALTGQFLSLILQSLVRGAQAPFEFEDLIDCPVSRFRLRGTDPNGPSICAFTQKLSCIPDQTVLVFDTTDLDSSSGLRLQTTPAHMMILWQPVNVIMQTKPSRNEKHSCSGLVAMGGIITPTETPGIGPSPWRWSELESLDIQQLRLGTTSGIGLHDKILLESCYIPEVDQQDFGLLETASLQMVHDTDSEHVTTASSASTAFTAMSTQGQGTLVETTETSSLDTPIGETLQDTEGCKIPPLRLAGEASVVTCPWNGMDAEAGRKEKMSNHLRPSGTMRGFVKVDSVQISPQLGISPLVTQIGVPICWSPSVTLKTTLLQKAQQKESSFIEDFDAYCGVFLSLHAGVVERVRLRDMVAFCALSSLVSAAVYEDSPNELIEMLTSSKNVVKWFQDRANSQETKKMELGKQLDKLTAQVLNLLKTSGISRRKSLVLLWPGSQCQQLKISRQMEKWIPILSDTIETSTFACIIPTCKETEECRCPMAQSSASSQQAVEWKFPEQLRLKTTLLGLRKSKHIRDNFREPLRLDQHRIYWINDPNLGLIAEVLGSSNQRKDKPVFYLSVRSTRVPGFFMKHFTAYPTMRESREGSPFDCILGSGDRFEREVQIHLERAKSGK